LRSGGRKTDITNSRRHLSRIAAESYGFWRPLPVRC